ncbi:hypothetical protein [Corynebacterium mucifaciens]|uniref:Uncharacterized protein n=1 Tax=Corynebacterium mucifaciens TaxID=57171 RepID=A0ABV2NXY5_9CORY|nr:hypothetical protein [Corynebacterium mucifaciens]
MSTATIAGLLADRFGFRRRTLSTSFIVNGPDSENQRLDLPVCE